MSSKWNSNRADDDPLLAVVRLFGWAHSDERIAFREIARQLCSAFSLEFNRSCSFGDNILFLRSVLSSLARAHKVAVFVLEDLDLFAKKAKQTLLYNLLDALVTTGFQAVVFGTTCRWDCVDQLEKRVRSRFSHRSLVLTQPRASKANIISPDATGLEKDCASEGAIDALKCLLTVPHDAFPDNQELVERHNTHIKAALENPAGLKAFQSYCAGRTSMAELSMIAESMLLWAPKENHRSDSGTIGSDALLSALGRIRKMDNGMVSMISSLSVLELAVLVSSHRSARKTDNNIINFEMAYHQFQIYSSSGDHVDNYTRRAASKAFERLISIGMISYNTGKRRSKNFRKKSPHIPVAIQCTEDEMREGLQQHSTCPPRLKDWYAREGGPVVAAFSYD